MSDEMEGHPNSLRIFCRICLLEISADVEDKSAFSGATVKALEALKNIVTNVGCCHLR
jgi:hypothetical protein